MNKKVFTSVDDSGNELELAILRPSPKQQMDAQLIFNKAWRKAEEAGCILRRDLDDLAEKRGLWNAEIRKRVNVLEGDILALERKLRAGSTFLSSLDEGREVALQIRNLRDERVKLLRARNELDSYTAESVADSERMQYLVSVTVVYNGTGKPYFKDYDDFVNKSNSKVAVDAMTNYIEMMYADIPDDRGELYENQFLKKYRFVDDQYRLINKDGKLVDNDGKLIDENGRYILENGSFCDRDGVPVDEEGNYLIEFKPFDNGV